MKEDFFVPFRNLRHINLIENLVRSINTLYFNSDYLADILIDLNELQEMDRFVFLNQNKTSINNLTIKLGWNYLKRLPKLYGNVSHINAIFMNDQKGSLNVMGDYFFDNSASFKVDNNVKHILVIIFNLPTRFYLWVLRSKYFLLMLL